MEFLTKPVQINTGAVLINIRLLLNDRQQNLSIMVTDGEDSKSKQLTAYPYHYNNIEKEEPKIKEYILKSLEKDYIYTSEGNYEYNPELATDLINYLKDDIKNKVKASKNFPEGNPKFFDIYTTCQKGNRTNSEYNIKDLKDNGKPTTPQAITREILINKYSDVIKDINEGKTKELVLDCKDFDITVNEDGDTQYTLLERLAYEPKKFRELIEKELNLLIHEKPPSINPYEIKEDDDLYYLRFKNMEETPLKYMLSDKVGRLTQTQGVIQGVYKIRPKLKKAVWECVGCMRLHEIDVPEDKKYIQPAICTECGGKTFRLRKDRSTYTNERQMLLTEPQEDLNLEDQPRLLLSKVVGNKALVNGITAGTRVSLTGVLNSAEDNKGIQDFIYNVNYFNKLEDKTIKVTSEDKKRFLKLSQREDILDILINSFAPDLILEPELKQSMLLYLVKAGEDNKGLDMIHILIISDPSTGKTKLKEEVSELSQKCILTSGTGASAVGLTGAIVKDPITSNWVLNAGAIPLADKGHCIIDEIDKMTKEDTTHANNFMESGHDEFNKAGVNGSLTGRTSILAMGNPKEGRFDRYKSLQDQIDIDPSFQSRFDLIFLIEDKPDHERDKQIINSILNGYDSQDNIKQPTTEDRLSTEDLKKYIAFASEFNPKLTPEAKTCINEYGIKAREMGNEEGGTNYHFRFIRSVPKLAGAFAKLRLKDNISNEDVQNAIHLKEHSINQIGLDPITNTIDTDRITGNLNQDDKRDRKVILELIRDYIERPDNLDKEGIPSAILLDNFQFKTDKSKNTFYRRLGQLKKTGEVVEIGKGRNKKYKLKSTE